MARALGAMSMFIRVFLVSALCWHPSHSFGQETERPFTGEDLKTLCVSVTAPSSECYAFFLGWSEASEAVVQEAAGTIYQQQGKVPSYEEWTAMASVLRGFCVPPEVTRGQAIAIVLSHLAKNPQIWHENAGPTVLSAMKQAFPCSWP
jgi:Rap1a immunity proteins